MLPSSCWFAEPHLLQTFRDHIAGEQQAFAPSASTSCFVSGIPVLVGINDRRCRSFLANKNCNGTANSAVTAVITRFYPAVFPQPILFAGPERGCGAFCMTTGCFAVLAARILFTLDRK